MRTSFRHQSEAQPPNGPLTAATSPDTPSRSHCECASIISFKCVSLFESVPANRARRIRLRAEALRDLAIAIDSVRRDKWSGVLRINRGTAGGLRSSRADNGAQVLLPARATVPPWLPAKSARVSNLPACCALGPPSCAAQYSCRREPCSARSAWRPLGRACRSAWIEHRSGEQRSP
jgi:hypothetical protein